MPEPQSSDGAISPAGAGGPMDLALEEGTSLEKNPAGPDGTGPAGKPRSLWSDA
ncbi:ABC transporter permease, partial [Streptomyces sp. SID7499]|nr:ABC transporter permease [Streptomyces sp. SID7499]